MLVITRSEGQTIILNPPNGQPIMITVIELRGKQVRIGIDVDQSIEIVRDDLRPEQRKAYNQARLKKLEQDAVITRNPKDGKDEDQSR